MIPIDLKGKVCLVTGGSQGLGAETARLLHEAGASVALNYYPDSGQSNAALARQVHHSLGDRCHTFAADVSDPKAATQLPQVVHRHFGRLDILVNNAGITRDRTLAKMSDQEWEDVISTNLSSVFYLTRATLPFLPEGGRIISVASISAAVGMFGQANYVAAKSGLMGLTKTLGRELAKRAITVNAIAPGYIDTEMSRKVDSKVLQDWISQIPMKRPASPREIAQVILFLASPLASYITSQTLHVNGGWYS